MIATVKRDGAGYPVTESHEITRGQVVRNAALTFAELAAAQRGVIAHLLILIHAKHSGVIVVDVPHGCMNQDCQLARSVVDAAGVRI